jgi:peptidoglycan hydrolase-like protein with peptidoglycan-binding domain
MNTASTNKNPRSFALVIGIVAAGVAALATALIISVSGHGGSTVVSTPNAPTSTSVPAQPTTPAQPVTPSHPVHPVQPSAAVVKLQQELGQLNYYMGPADGIMGPQTIQSITYLQRDAHLPQTGQMNAATQAALANFLAHGNNQMGG